MLSYARGPEQPLLETTLYAALTDTAARYPDGAALVSRHQNLRFTWRELAQAVEQTAGLLEALGIGPQDRVGIWATNRAEWILVQLAAARLGAVVVNVNPAYRTWELDYVLRKSRIRALFLAEGDARSDYRGILAGCSTQPEHVIYFDTMDWQLRDPIHAAALTTPEDPTNIQYTSGTTGSPKGVVLTHHNLLNNAQAGAEALRFSHADKLCVPVPLYHCFGCVFGTLVCVLTGATMILPSPSFDPGLSLRAIEEERATAIYGVPTMFIAELNHASFGERDLTSLRTGIMAGAPCPIEVMRRVVSDMHCSEMIIIYGQTESSPGITGSSTTDPLEIRVGTVGRALPNIEVKIVDPETGETVPAEAQGELCARGYMVMQGYDGDPEATARAVDPEGWLHTGDLAVMRADQCFRITGRARDLIIRGGENIYPREVEEFLYTHPAIADVQVVGLPDALLGETVCAWIKLRHAASEDEIRAYCRGKIAHFKIPQYIRFVDEFPMTITGKIQKFRIRECEIEARNLTAAAQIPTA